MVNREAVLAAFERGLARAHERSSVWVLRLLLESSSDDRLPIG